MNQDNVRLALWISGIWGGLIIIIVGIEAIVHDGAIAITIVDTFSKVLFGLGAVVGAVSGLAKFVESRGPVSVASSPLAAAVAAVEPVSSPAGSSSDAAAAISGTGV